MGTQEKKIPILVASDAVDFDIADYLDDKHSALHELVRLKKYTVKNTEVTYRVINHWDEKGILPDGADVATDGWRKFSLIEILWLEAVKRFREFGLPLETIKKIKDDVLIWDKDSQAYYWFEYYAIKAKTSSMDGYIIATADGNAALAFSRQLEANKIFFGSRTFLLVSFKELWSAIGLSSPNPETLLNLSSEEIDIIDTIRNQNVDKISLNIRGGKVKSYDTSKTIVTGDVKSITKEIEEAGAFADILTKFERGKAQTVEIKKKKKF